MFARVWPLLSLVCVGCGGALGLELEGAPQISEGRLAFTLSNGTIDEAVWSPCDQLGWKLTPSGREAAGPRPYCNLSSIVPGLGSLPLTPEAPTSPGRYLLEVVVLHRGASVRLESAPFDLP